MHSPFGSRYGVELLYCLGLTGSQKIPALVSGHAKASLQVIVAVPWHVRATVVIWGSVKSELPASDRSDMQRFNEHGSPPNPTLLRGTTHGPAEGRAIVGGLSRPVAGASWVDTTLGRSFDEPNTGLFHPITNRGALHHHESATVAGQRDLSRDRFLNPRSNPGCRTGHKIVDEEPAFASRGNGPHEMLGQL